MSLRFAAAIYIVIELLLAAFVLALSAGVSWKVLTFGRAQAGQLSTERRLSALWSAMILVITAAIVATSAGIILPKYLMLARSMMWIVVATNALAAAVYLLSRSRWARRVWFPVFLALTIGAIVVLRLSS